MNKKILTIVAGAALALTGAGLLFLTSSSLVSFRKPYINQLAPLTAVAGPVAFVNVNVIPMNDERVISNQTALIENGLIVRIDDVDNVALPPDSLIIDGRDRYLMPGLADMHVHIKDENDLLLFVANGVTTVRDMWGTDGVQLGFGFPDQLELRERISQGQLLGPTLYIAGPVMEGEPATMPFMSISRTPAEAASAVAEQKKQGYDFIKVYDNLTPEVYAAILEAAREHDLPVIGHVPWQVGLDAALAGGQQSIEHLTGYIDPDRAEFLIPEDRLAEYARLTAVAGVWNCPTLSVYPLLSPTISLADLEEQPGMAYVAPRFRFVWRVFRRQMQQSVVYEGSDYGPRMTMMNQRMTKLLHDNGAPLILGTDAGNPYLTPGFSLHQELELMVAAGLTPYEALRAGTINAAASLGKEDEFGSLSVGQRADAILLEANPLEDVRNASRRAGVMLRGHWFTADDLQQLLSGLQESHRASLLERFWPAVLIIIGAALTLKPVIRKS